MNKLGGPSKLKAQNEGLPTPNQQQAAEYIASASLGLSGMAEQAGLPFLKYLLDIAVEEAMQRSDMPDRRRAKRQ